MTQINYLCGPLKQCTLS